MEITSQRFAHLSKAATRIALGQFAHAWDGLRSHAPPNDPPLGYSEGEAEELGVGARVLLLLVSLTRSASFPNMVITRSSA
jgi:hypothetical protein